MQLKFLFFYAHLSKIQGKTYTLYGALEYISNRLQGKNIQITFYEVHGKKCYDLLSNRNIVHLRSDAQDNMHLRGARVVQIAPLTSSTQLIDVLKEALRLRSSTVTERNPISSRSHAVCTIELFELLDQDQNQEKEKEKASDLPPPPPSPSSGSDSAEPAAEAEAEAKAKAATATPTSFTAAPANASGGTGTAGAKDRSLGHYLASKGLSTAPKHPPAVVGSEAVPPTSTNAAVKITGKITLVDLAGSERNYETTQMTAAQHKESADINVALMALKDCFRAYHAQLTKQLYGTSTAPVISNNISGANALSSGVLAPNLFNSTTNATGAITLIHNVGGVSNAKVTSLHAGTGGMAPEPVPTAASNASAGCEKEGGVPAPPPSDSSSPIITQQATTTAAAAAADAPIRIPFRASLLTKVLKQCFTSGPDHRTTIIATLSPTPTDLQHSLNTLNHVVLMCPELQQLIHRVTVEVPLNLHLQMATKYNAKVAHGTGVGSGLSTRYVADWTAEEVIAWLATAERGRFAHVVLPAGITGAGLLQLSVANLADLFGEMQMNVARTQREGAAWVETVADESNKVRGLGRALWSALRREMQNILARESIQQQQAMK
jgi:hypothetical protein